MIKMFLSFFNNLKFKEKEVGNEKDKFDKMVFDSLYFKWGSGSKF